MGDNEIRSQEELEKDFADKLESNNIDDENDGEPEIDMNENTPIFDDPEDIDDM